MTEPGAVSFAIWGSDATVISSAPGRIVSAVSAVDSELADIARTCSRFVEGSDISRVNANGGRWTRVDPLLVSAVEVALHAARTSGGLVDPTVGAAMHRIGYDRDFSEIAANGPELQAAVPAPGWWLVDVDRDRSMIHVPAGVSLDLGATAKAFAADRAAERAVSEAGCGVLVSIGGDVSTAGDPPLGGWTIGISDDHRDQPELGESVAIKRGGLATSSATVRRWTRGGRTVHHIVDPRTGEPAHVVWRTVSVAAADCVSANTASTASIVMGEMAASWLRSRNLYARLVRADGSIVRVGGWPERAAA
jgi:thiamine biosynthesis lipoprotein